MTSFNDLHVEFTAGSSATMTVSFVDGEMIINIIGLNSRGKKIAKIRSRDYDRMLPPYYAILPPICSTPDGEICITQYMKYNWKKKILYIPHESHNRASLHDIEACNSLLQRAVFTEPELRRLYRDFSWAPERKYLTRDELMMLMEKQIPSCYNAERWRLIRKNSLIYEKITSKLYQFAHENLGPTMLQRITSNESNLRVEYIPSRLKARDVAGKVVLPFGSPELLYNNKYLVMSDTQQSGKAGEIVHLSLGTKIDDDGNIVAHGREPVSWIFAHNPFHKHIKPNRQIVARYTTQACELIHDEDPLITNINAEHATDPTFRPHGLNLLAARMEYYGYTHEDGCVISDEVADKFLTIVKHYDIFRARDVKLAVAPMRITDQELIIAFKSISNSIGEVVNMGHLGTCKSGELRSSLHRRAIITDVRISQGDDTDTSIQYVQIESSYPLRLRIGDKLADHHGNKVIIAKVLPKKRMPKIPGLDDKHLDIIVPPYLGKRCCPSRMLEEMYSIYLRYTRPAADGTFMMASHAASYKDASKLLKSINKSAKGLVVDWDKSNWHENVAFGWVRYFRLEQHSEIKAKASKFIDMDYRGIVTRGKGLYNLADVMYGLYSVKADNIIKEITEEVKSTNTEEMVRDHLKCFGFTIEGGIIKHERVGFLVPKDQVDGIIIDRTIDRNALTAETDNITSELREHTVLDSRLLQSNGYLKVPNAMCLTLASYAKALKAQYYDPTRFTRNARMERDGVETNDVNMESDGELYLRLPKTLKAHMLNNGNFTASDMQNAVNTLLIYFNNFERHQNSQYQNPHMGIRMIRRSNFMFNKIMEGIGKKLFSKTGMIRMLAFPRVLRTCHAVIAGNPLLDLETCEIPVRLFKKWCADPRFRKSLRIPEDGWKDRTAESLNVILKEKNAKCLLTRNPAHQVNNVAGFKLRVWRGSAIRFNPALVGIFDGDFDGDTMVAYVPIGKEAKTDLDKIWITKYLDLMPCSKALKGLKSVPHQNLSEELVTQEFMLSSGDSENLSDIRHCYTPEKTRDFIAFTHGHHSISELMRLQASAAAEFRFMKEGAANAGNIGNIMRNIMLKEYGRMGITWASDLYHSLAQPALDSKNSEGMKKTLDLVTGMLRSLKPVKRQTLQDELAKLVRLPETAIKVTECMFKDGKWQSGVSVMCAKNTPVAHLVASGGVISLHRAAAIGDDGSLVSHFLQMTAGQSYEHKGAEDAENGN